jgi:hypothetical protein
MTMSLDDRDRVADVSTLIHLKSSSIWISDGNDELPDGLVQYLAVLGEETETMHLRLQRATSYVLASIAYRIRVPVVSALSTPLAEALERIQPTGRKWQLQLIGFPFAFEDMWFFATHESKHALEVPIITLAVYPASCQR